MKKNLLAAILVFGFGSSALAAAPDSSGKITIDGTVDAVFSISKATAGEGTLAETVTFSAADLGNNTNSIKAVPVTFRLRSNAPYSLTASYTGTSTSDVGPEDIGFAITQAVATGALTVSEADRTATTNTVDTITTQFEKTHTGTGDDSAAFGTAVLATLDTVNELLSGGRISNKGGFSNPNNALDVTAEVAMLPQFFTAGDFNYVVTLTVTNQ
jgi:hypothetical protein